MSNIWGNVGAFQGIAAGTLPNTPTGGDNAVEIYSTAYNGLLEHGVLAEAVTVTGTATILGSKVIFGVWLKNRVQLTPTLFLYVGEMFLRFDAQACSGAGTMVMTVPYSVSTPLPVPIIANDLYATGFNSATDAPIWVKFAMGAANTVITVTKLPLIGAGETARCSVPLVYVGK